MNLEIEYKATMVALYKCKTSSNDPQILAVFRHHNFKALHSPNTSLKLVYKTLLQISTIQLHGRPSTRTRYMDKWRQKAIHSKLPKYLDQDHTDMELSIELMEHTGLKGETEGLITES